jgi:predicted GIY-YIG superfamily endonuclease
VPTESGCYALCSFDTSVLYVGLTDNLNRRFEEHVADDAKRAVVGAVRTFWFYWVTAPLAAVARIERGWQNQHAAQHGRLPALNKIQSPIR